MNKLNTLTSLQAYFPACTAEQVRTTARLRCTNIYHVYRGVPQNTYDQNRDGPNNWDTGVLI